MFPLFEHEVEENLEHTAAKMGTAPEAHCRQMGTAPNFRQERPEISDSPHSDSARPAPFWVLLRYGDRYGVRGGAADGQHYGDAVAEDTIGDLDVHLVQTDEAGRQAGENHLRRNTADSDGRYGNGGCHRIARGRCA